LPVGLVKVLVPTAIQFVNMIQVRFTKRIQKKID